VLKEPKDVAQQRRDEEAAANAARRAAAFVKADERTKMKGKNKPTRRQKKKQMNIIEERKPALRTKLQQEVRHWEWWTEPVFGACMLMGSGTNQEGTLTTCAVLCCAVVFVLLQERERAEAAQEAKRQKLETVPRALQRLYE
jgi:hypothetical protein